MHRQLGEAGVAFERLEAVDGVALGDKAIDAFRQARKEGKPEGWLPGEVGCFLSHLEAWKRIAAAADEWAAVFEDDIRVSPRLGALLASTGWIPADADIVRLEANRSMRLGAGRAIDVLPDRKVHRALSGSPGSAAYIISKTAVGKIVETPPELHTSVDVFLFKPKVSRVARVLKRYQVVPALCVQESVLASGEVQLRSLIRTRETRGRGYRARSHPLLRLWPIRRLAVPFRP